MEYIFVSRANPAYLYSLESDSPEDAFKRAEMVLGACDRYESETTDSPTTD